METLAIISILLMVLATLAVAVRFYMRAIKGGQNKPMEYTLIIALVMMLCFVGFQIRMYALLPRLDEPERLTELQKSSARSSDTPSSVTNADQWLHLGLHLMTDIGLCVLPFPALMRVSEPRLRAAVCGIYGLAVISIAVTIIRAILLATDAQNNLKRILILTAIELTVCILIGVLPGVSSAFTRRYVYGSASASSKQPPPGLNDRLSSQAKRNFTRLKNQNRPNPAEFIELEGRDREGFGATGVSECASLGGSTDNIVKSDVKDLLRRHARISHNAGLDMAVSQAEDSPMSAVHDTAEMSVDNPEFLDFGLMAQDMLSANFFDAFDANFPIIHAPSSNSLPRIRSICRFNSRLPPVLDDEMNLADEDRSEGTPDAKDPPWSITERDYDRLRLATQEFSAALPLECSFPSRDMLMGQLEAYLRCARGVLPFIHTPTFSAGEKDVELLLAMAAIGALYRIHRTKAYESYFIAKAILSEKVRRDGLKGVHILLSGASHSTPESMKGLGRIQTLILLITFASWADKSLSSDALAMGSQLSYLVREQGISEPDETPNEIDWLSWVTTQERRRTLLAAYVQLNLLTVVFDIPSLILNHEVRVCLPSCAEPWKAENAAQWRAIPRQLEREFGSSLRSLFDGMMFPRESGVSSSANYVLIHGVLQQLWTARLGSTGLLPPDCTKSFERALRTWQLSWELTPESTLDPLSPKGPFELSATALLRLAYIRLAAEPRLGRALLLRDLQCTRGIHLNLKRSPLVDRAATHAVHALSILTRLGLGFIAQTNISIWGIEHSVSSLECALLLKDWLANGLDGYQAVGSGIPGRSVI
ncbi:hypothetical protein DL770_007831 [Monosporascus sp. CRB-9-2]|nr:hypothetical protein DL770_007831 [Monosporascus sp. CRB-9-2]